MRKQWRAGDLMSVAAGVTLMVCAFLPWADVEGDQFSGLAMRMYRPFGFALLAGALLVAFGLARTPWAGVAGLAVSFASAVVVLWIRSGVHGGLVEVVGVPAAAIGPNVGGYGEYALFAAGALAGAAGVVTVIQRQLPVGRPQSAG